MKQIVRALLAAMLLISCAEAEKECECSIQDDVPNFEFRSSYSFKDNPNSIFKKDTVMLYFYVEMCGGSYVRELNYKTGVYSWHDENNGKEISDGMFQFEKLNNCLKLYKWQVNKPKN
jgi:hypothetical protein